MLPSRGPVPTVPTVFEIVAVPAIASRAAIRGESRGDGLELAKSYAVTVAKGGTKQQTQTSFVALRLVSRGNARHEISIQTFISHCYIVRRVIYRVKRLKVEMAERGTAD